VDALQESLGLTLNIPEEPQVAGAVGAACAARGREETGELEVFPASGPLPK
jgi:activator of 2-hydroxyglutaryl-CoA dehydratase